MDRLHTLSIRRQSIFKSFSMFSLLVDSRSKHRIRMRVRTLKLLALERISLDSLTARSSCGVSSCYHYTAQTDRTTVSLTSKSSHITYLLDLLTTLATKAKMKNHWNATIR